MNLQNILESVIETFTGHNANEQPNRHNGQTVLDASEDPYGDPADQGYGQQAGYNDTFNGQQVLPASQDPYGDPADMFNGHQVLDASHDPYGDPADTFNGQQVLPASQDPYGDPADQR